MAIRTGRIVVAGLSSSSGKTTVSVALMSALKRRGYSVMPYKVGPDFIDTKYHEIASGNYSYNLDGFMTSADYIRKKVASREADGTVSVIEGVMGLYDGVKASSDFGSTAWVARLLGAPVLCVIDVGAMMRTVLAIADGIRYSLEKRGISLAGFVLNRTGGDAHYEQCRRILVRNGYRVFGHIPFNADLEIGERHLGLKFGDIEAMKLAVEKISAFAEQTLDIDRIAQAYMKFKYTGLPKPHVVRRKRSKCRIAVPVDQAFNFYYRENLELLERAGAEIVTFQLINSQLPEKIQGLYIGGGYPELFADTISSKRKLLDEIVTMANEGIPIYAECGGYMLLSRTLRDASGRTFRMAGLFDTEIEMQNRPTIGYRCVEFKEDSFMGDRNMSARGHEFHYAIEKVNSERKAFKMFLPGTNKYLDCGAKKYNAIGSFVHLHFSSNPNIYRRFINSCISPSSS